MQLRIWQIFHEREEGRVNNKKPYGIDPYGFSVNYQTEQSAVSSQPCG